MLRSRSCSHPAVQPHHAGDGAISHNQTDGPAALGGWLEPRFLLTFCLLSFLDREGISRILSSLRCQTFAENIS
jgi:hypothetical protein